MAVRGIHVTGVSGVVGHPRAGVHDPRSVGEFQAWFGTDADCRDYLEWLRWPTGFVCPDCCHDGGWRLGDGRFMCAFCGGRTSVTAGTIFDRTRTPLTVWFTASWLFASGKDGISALSLHDPRTTPPVPAVSDQTATSRVSQQTTSTTSELDPRPPGTPAVTTTPHHPPKRPPPPVS